MASQTPTISETVPYTRTKLHESTSNIFLGTYTSSTRPTGLTTSDVGKYCYLSDTKDFVFWTGTAWNDQD